MNRMKRNASVTVLNGNFQQNHTNTRNIASRTEKRCISMSVKRLHNSFMLLCPKRGEKKLLFFRWSASIFYFHFFCSHFFLVWLLCSVHCTVHFATVSVLERKHFLIVTHISLFCLFFFIVCERYFSGTQQKT